jgi:hypothetical protein
MAGSSIVPGPSKGFRGPARPFVSKGLSTMSMASKPARRRIPASLAAVGRGRLIRFAVRASAATAFPVLLLLTAGTAHALTGPGMHFAMNPGSLTVSINDNSGVSSWCSFDADFYHAPQFFLEANKTYDVVIAPAVPFNRTWNVDVKCDNGTSTHGVYYY